LLDENTITNYGVGGSTSDGMCVCCKTPVQKVIGCDTEEKSNQSVCIRVWIGEKTIPALAASFPNYTPDARSISVTLHTSARVESAIVIS